MVVGFIIAAATPALISTVIQAERANRESRSPKIQAGDTFRLAFEIQALTDRGLQPVTSTDPFTGNIVLSTQDQAGHLFDILGTKFASEALAGTPAESAAIFAAREAFIEERRGGPVAGPVAPTLRETVVEALAPATGHLLAPGVVSKKISGMAVSRRLGGPCAGANTGFARLNCARGGFA